MNFPQIPKMAGILVLGIVVLVIAIVFMTGSKLPFSGDKDQISKQKVIPTPTKGPVLFACPVEESQCSKLAPFINSKKEYVSVIAQQLSDKTEVKAVMKGNYKAVEEEQGKEIKTTIVLTSPDEKYQATYIFAGTAVAKEGSVMQKETLGNNETSLQLQNLGGQRQSLLYPWFVDSVSDFEEQL